MKFLIFANSLCLVTVIGTEDDAFHSAFFNKLASIPCRACVMIYRWNISEWPTGGPNGVTEIDAPCLLDDGADLPICPETKRNELRHNCRGDCDHCRHGYRVYRDFGGHSYWITQTTFSLSSDEEKREGHEVYDREHRENNKVDKFYRLH